MNTPFDVSEASIRIAPGRRIIPAKDYERFVEASDIVQIANDKASKIERKAMKVYEEQKLKGYQDGIAQANDEKAVFCYQVAQDFNTVILNIEDKIASIFPQIIRNLLVDLGEEFTFKSYISKALQELVHEEKLIIKVHPSKRTMLEVHIESLQKKSGYSFKSIVVHSDSSLEGEQATIETSSSIVVLDLQRQLDLLEAFALSKLAETPVTTPHSTSQQQQTIR